MKIEQLEDWDTDGVPAANVGKLVSNGCGCCSVHTVLYYNQDSIDKLDEALAYLRKTIKDVYTARYSILKDMPIQ